MCGEDTDRVRLLMEPECVCLLVFMQPCYSNVYIRNVDYESTRVTAQPQHHTCINIRAYTSSVHVLLGNDLIDRNIPLVLLPRVLV